MRLLLLALLLSIPPLAYSQAIAFEGRSPVASLTANAAYIFHYDDENSRVRTLWGWSAVPEVNLIRHFGVEADVASFYMRSTYPGQNRFILAGGPRYNLAPPFRFEPLSRAMPFVFAEGGEIKLTSQGSPVKQWRPLATVGVGFEYRLSPRLAFTLVPGEYVGQKESDGTWNHSFAARGGVTFNFYR